MVSGEVLKLPIKGTFGWLKELKWNLRGCLPFDPQGFDLILQSTKTDILKKYIHTPPKHYLLH